MEEELNTPKNIDSKFETTIYIFRCFTYYKQNMKTMEMINNFIYKLDSTLFKIYREV